jgi:hypothetical protein
MVFYPPATPVDVMVIPRTSEKRIMPKLMIGCQGQWRAGPMNRIIFQPDGTRMVPIIPSFHYSKCERSELSCSSLSIPLQDALRGIFMSRDALKKFRGSKGWEAGVDGNVALITADAGESAFTAAAKDPMAAFVFDVKGLMADMPLKGAKFNKLDLKD